MLRAIPGTQSVLRSPFAELANTACQREVDGNTLHGGISVMFLCT